MTKTWLGLSMIGGSVLMLAASAWADSQAGKEAYRRGDFETAVKELRPLGKREMLWPSSTWGPCTSAARVCPRIISKRCDGIAELRNRDMHRPSLT